MVRPSTCSRLCDERWRLDVTNTCQRCKRRACALCDCDKTLDRGPGPTSGTADIAISLGNQLHINSDEAVTADREAPTGHCSTVHELLRHSRQPPDQGEHAIRFGVFSRRHSTNRRWRNPNLAGQGRPTQAITFSLRIDGQV